MSIGQRLREIRRERKISQEDLGKSLGRIQSEIYRWEKGIVRIPAEELPALAAALEVPIDAFFSDEMLEPSHA